jgi:competence protein ComEA
LRATRALGSDTIEPMPALSRTQLLVYGAIAVALLLLGARWIRSAEADGSAAGEVSYGFGGGDAAEGAGGSGSIAFDAQGGDLVVHVAGAVGDPGVYRLPAGSRVTDAVERAGGPGRDAALDAINLAARLADGQQVVVPATVKSGAAIAAGVGLAGADPDAPISLGSATIEQLDTVEGIGPVTAQNIIDFRDEHGGLSSIEELDEISGIGPATMESLRGRLQP